MSAVQIFRSWEEANCCKIWLNVPWLRKHLTVFSKNYAVTGREGKGTGGNKNNTVTNHSMTTGIQLEEQNVKGNNFKRQ